MGERVRIASALDCCDRLPTYNYRRCTVFRCFVRSASESKPQRATFWGGCRLERLLQDLAPGVTSGAGAKLSDCRCESRGGIHGGLDFHQHRIGFAEHLSSPSVYWPPVCPDVAKADSAEFRGERRTFLR
jgi:hypothetical protein